MMSETMRRLIEDYGVAGADAHVSLTVGIDRLLAALEAVVARGCWDTCSRELSDEHECDCPVREARAILAAAPGPIPGEEPTLDDMDGDAETALASVFGPND